MTENRKEGFYWILQYPGRWEVGRWTGQHWLLTGSTYEWHDRNFLEIGRRFEKED